MSDLFSRFGRVLRGLGSRASDVDPDDVVRAWREARQAQQEGPSTEWEQTRERARRAGTVGGLPAEIERAYANLELTPPADLAQAKAAWRNLMRKYHPDKHQSDPKKAELANKVAARLTDAYRIVQEHLES